MNPNAAQPAGGPPTSFKTNVNRAKTKRWVEAKTVSYDGDDWGEADEYDEYSGYSAGAVQKPTGLRQQGQSTLQPAGVLGRSDTQASPAAYGERMYIAPGGKISQLHQGFDEQIAPGPQAYQQPKDARTYSLSQGEERRAFSGGSAQYGNTGDLYPSQGQFQQTQGMHQTAPQIRAPAPGQYQQVVQGGSNPSLDGQSRLASGGPPPPNYRGVAYSDRPRPPHEGSRTQSMSSSTSSQDFQARRDFSPSAVPQPLHPQSRDLPPRKSSLSQEDTPRIPGGPFSPATNIQSEHSEAATLSRPTESENRTDVASKPLPFVRPADIYKRLAAERERERQSQESSRPSMEAILDSKQLSTTEDSATNIRGHPNTDDSRFTPRGRPSFEGEDISESGRPIKTSLDPVVERRSEYGMEGPSLNTAVPANQAPIPNSTRLPEMSKPTETTVNKDGSPRLPEVPRMSGFGESFLGSMQGSFNATPDVDTPETGHLQFLSKLSEEPLDASLQHQTSVGFRSVVNKAFEDQVPQTPSSAAGSALARSNSESTNAISPIISRAPSAVNSGAKHKELETRDESIARITEEPTTRAPMGRPGSGDTIVTPKATTRKPSPSQAPWHGPAESLPTNTGHRRNISTPSPGDSPARTPAVEVSQHLRQPQEAELAVTTPTSITHSSSSASNAMPSEASNRSEKSADASVEPSAPIQRPSQEPYAVMPLASDSVGDSVTGPRSAIELNSPVTPTKTFPSGRAESPTKSRSRVRDLADRFESEGSIRRDSGLSLRESALIERPNENLHSRPQNDRMESFRPHLPGGWESYASTAPGSGPMPVAQNRGQTLGPQVSTQAEYDDVNPSTTEIQATESSRSNKSDGNRVKAIANTENQYSLRDHASTLTDHSSAPANEGFSLSDPFSAVAAAGTALAGAVTAAVGFDPKDSESEEETNSRDETPAMNSTNINQGRSASIRNTAFHPEASRPWMPPEDDSASSVSHTPLTMDPDDHQHQSENPNYFPPVVPLKQRPRDIQTTNEVTPLRPQILPALSTETSPNDYESDRLRKQLVRELSPHAENFPHDQTAALDAPLVEESRLPDTSGLRSQDHDSMFLPREYDSYWNSSNSGDILNHRVNHQEAPESPEIRSELNEKIAVEGGALPYAETRHQTIPMKLDSTQQAPNSNMLQVRPTHLAHRFSWEPEPEELNAERQELPGVNNGNQSPPITAPTVEYIPLPVNSPTADIPQLHKKLPEEPAELAQEFRHSTESHRQQQQDHEFRVPNDTQMSSEAETMSIPPLPTEQPKIPAFREILALKNSTDRIQAFKTTRDQFANMNTGLDHWIVATLNDLPEHAELRNNGGTFGNVSSHRPSPSRGKFPGLRVASGQTQSQPYYQQYLNASSQPGISSPAVSTSANVAGSPNYSPASASGKAPVQQMQAKGKDLLHSAGIFGGKANVAAKGLFSKGKSKLRGSGGADKVDF